MPLAHYSGAVSTLKPLLYARIFRVNSFVSGCYFIVCTVGELVKSVCRY